MDLRPIDLPRLRGDLLEFARRETAVWWREIDIEEGRLPEISAMTREEAARQYVEADIAMLLAADLFYITGELSELADVAARSLPPFAFLAEDLPARQGLMWFARHIGEVDVTEHPVPVVAIGWDATGTAVRVVTYVDRDTYNAGAHPDLHRYVPAVFALGSAAYEFGEDRLRADAPGGLMLAVAKTVWLLMSQPLAEESLAVYDRASRRRLQREGKVPPPIRVIALRRPPHGGSSGEGGREWHHQWIVRGHWRQQAWGPGRERRRPVWITPYVKGPEGAPMIGGAKVYTVSDH